MKLLSLTVRDFRGLGEARIEPAPRGVTVVTGPNESGKTSLVEAFDLLLDKLDNSVAGEVREAQPVGRDVGPEVEAEIEAGDYRFRLRKRFVKAPQTELEVLAPRPQQLTGREAHERAMEILATAGVDLDLWRALRVEQGQGVQQPEDLATSRSLLDALGGAGERTEGGGRAAELHELARDEFERYFTPKRGEPTGELRRARDELEQAAAAAEALESRAARLDADAARADQLERRLVELRGLAAAAAERRETAAAEAKKVGELAAEVERRRSQAREEEEVRDRLRELAEAGEAEREVGGRLEAARAGAGEAAAALAPAETELEGAVAAARAAEQNRERLAAALRIAERWEARQRTADELVRRGERVAEVAAQLTAAEVALGELPAVDEAALERLEALHAEVERLGAAREAASPRLELTARRGLELTVEGDGTADGEADGEADGKAAALAEGEGWEARPAAPVRLRIGDASGAVAELSVVPGGDVAELSRRLGVARQGLADGCAALAVDDLAAAREVAKRRRAAASAVASARAALAEASGGEAAESYAERREAAAREAAELGERLRAVVAEAGLDADDVDEDEGAVGPRQLEEALAAAGERLAAAAERARRARGHRDELRRRLETSRNTERELAVEQRNAAERHRRARQRAEGLLRWQEELGEVEAPVGDGVSTGAAAEPPSSDQLGLFAAVAEGGAERPDDGAPPPLTAALDAAGERLAAAMTALDAARRDLARAEPAAVERRLQAAEAERRRLVAELRAGEDERIEVRARLEAAGESDLYESLERSRGRLAAARSAAASVEARAAAARRLHEALSAAREAARRAYSEPLRRKIEELGAGVFGDGFAIELDDELRVARRTVGGVTLDTPRLSTGAREQLSLLSRLACAVLVAPGGGVPLVLDDALGNTDRRRARAMAEVLARAGEYCQVLVLTSEPERYQDVRGVHEIDLVA